MFQVTKSVEYAILLLVGLYKTKGKPVSLASLAQIQGLPHKYLEKIAAKLKKKDILASSQGVNGGYFFKKKPSQVSLQDIILSVDGRKGLVSCLYGKCDLEDSCFHKKVWLNLQQKLFKELEQIKLSDLVS